MLEHIRDWAKAVQNMKAMLKYGGIILITTRSVGFHVHGYPEDYWRFDKDDMKHIFSDFEIVALEDDTHDPGVFVKARACDGISESLSAYKAYSIHSKERDVVGGWETKE